MSSQPKYLFVYGDSYSDSQIETRRTNGPLWSEQLAKSWGTTLISNAEHGARFCQNKTFKNSKSWLRKQIDASNVVAEEEQDTSVHVIFLGVTELIETKGSAKDIEDWVKCLKEQVMHLSSNKPNSRIVIMGVPPIEFSPFAVKNQIQGLKEKALGLNVAIEEAVGDWQQESISVEFFDTYLAFSDLLGDLSTSQIKNVEDAYWDTCQGLCKDDLDSYLWWDTIHMTGSGHKVISDGLQAKEFFDIKAVTTSAAAVDTPGVDGTSYSTGFGSLSPEFMRSLSWFILGSVLVLVFFMFRHHRAVVSLRQKFRTKLGKIYPSVHQNHEYTLV